ncbi:DUF2585 domain-containing protein [Roseibium limicola]|uniref:UPF0314 protein J0X15_09035 n=1 Tax=Roseibium limicola TaxID=2816037 RepID=A0A939EPY3_9HYPH|nr:DUF2585 domain-containing protein [Roseibium limicola]MBO0345363.1 DUF2585 domain-containing protein [Roseibium limicola]
MSRRLTWALGFGLLVLTAVILLSMGRIPICACGTIKLWTPVWDEAGNSQHIADWYTLSHIIHGFLFYGLFWLLLRNRPVGERALTAIIVEAAWEILENSPIIIDRYREATIAVGYTGDSVLNSMSDIVFMLVGFWFAWKMPLWVTVVLGILFELLALYVIRDNLTLNVLMLVYPVDAVRQWQGG